MHTRCLTGTQALLPSIARDRCRELLDELTTANAKVSAIPASVEQFVEIMAFLSKVRNEMEDTEGLSTSFWPSLPSAEEIDKTRCVRSRQILLRHESVQAHGLPRDCSVGG